MDTSQIGLAGEFYVLAQVTQRGLVGTLTLGNTKSVDIVVYNPKTSKYWRVEVKTSAERPRLERMFAEEKTYSWQLSQKHETLAALDLVYVFVSLSDPEVLPRFFVVPASKVAEYVAWEHAHWLASPHKAPVKDGNMRRFRIEESDPQGYSGNWSLFSAP